MKKFLPWIVVLLSTTSAALPSVANEIDSAFEEDERLVESAGLPCEGPVLLDFFRCRSRTETAPGRIDSLISRLAGPSLQDRIQAGVELVAEGPLAVPGLRRVANDLEAADVKARAQRCLKWVEGPHSAALTAAAARVLGRLRPAGAAEALLAYLPFACDEEIVREIAAALQAVAVAEGRLDQALMRALGDSMPLRRAIAATVLCQVAPEQRPAVENLLQDANPEVRMEAALALAKAHNSAGIPVLIDLLAVLPANKRGQVEEVLQEFAGEWAPTGGPAGEDEISRRIRRDAWAAWWANTESPALLAMIRKRTLTPAEQDQVKDAIRRLGDNAYTVREKAVVELIANGRRIIPLLREVVKNGELEMVRRAQRCIQQIEDEPSHRLPAAALRLLALRKPAEAAESLLSYLPFAEDETLSEVQSALNVLALRDEKPEPALLRALVSTAPAVRAAAAEALAQGGGPDALPPVRKLLEDADLTVRLRAGLALAPKDSQAVPVLIGLIGVLPAEESGQIHDFLTPLAGDLAPSAPEDNAEARKKSSVVWADWWKDNAAKADLAKLANPQQYRLGFTIICEHNTGRIFELGRDRKPRWSFSGTQNPTDALALPNNRVLIAEYGANKVTERDIKGNVIWQKQLNGNPHNIQRLPNGHTFITTNVSLVEVDRTGKDVFNLGNLNQVINNFGQLVGGYKSRKGQIVCVTQNGQVFHLDAAGKQLKSFNTNRNNAWMDMQPNGRILLAQNGGNQIAEYDPDGKLLLQLTVNQVSTVTGLPNGNIMAASHSTGRIMELDRKGRVVWEYATPGPFRARGR